MTQAQWTERYLQLSAQDLETEWTQATQEGRDLTSLAADFDRLRQADLNQPAAQAAALELLDRTIAQPIRADYGYREPSDLPGIHAARPIGDVATGTPPTGDALYDRIHGAWLGRVCGCLLGKPVEGWRTPRLWGYLRDADRWPLSDYFTLDVPPEIAARYELDPARGWIDGLDHMPEDDDTNYTTIGLALLTETGPDFVSADMARFWLRHLPILHTFTAERIAYRNLCLNIPPPTSASYRNPYREWIGAQIRADAFGYVCPGNPELAAALAWRDAAISHVKNGIYGEMWVAAMLAIALTTDDLLAVIRGGLAQIPAQSRLAEAIQRVMVWHAEGIGYDDAVARLHDQWDEQAQHDWCHTISNAMICAIGLLWGDLDYELSICRAVQPGFDTDCNGATVGSVVGAILGAQRLPAKWTAPVNDTLETGVAGYHRVRISDMARKTLNLVDLVQAQS